MPAFMPWAMDESDLPKQDAQAAAFCPAANAPRVTKAWRIRFMSQIADSAKLHQKVATIGQQHYRPQHGTNRPEEVIEPSP